MSSAPLWYHNSAGGGSVALEHFLTSGVCSRDRVSGCDGYGGNVVKGFTLVAMVFPTLGVR